MPHIRVTIGDGETYIEGDTAADVVTILRAWREPEQTTVTCKIDVGDALKGTVEELKSALAADAGWITWNGGEMPVDKGTRIRVKWRNGHEFDTKAGLAGAVCWDHCAIPDRAEIVAYKVITE